MVVCKIYTVVLIITYLLLGSYKSNVLFTHMCQSFSVVKKNELHIFLAPVESWGPSGPDGALSPLPLPL